MAESTQAKRAITVPTQDAEALRVPVTSKPVVGVTANLSPVCSPIIVDMVDGKELFSRLTATCALIAVRGQRSATSTCLTVLAILSSLLRVSFVPRTNAGSTRIFIPLVPPTIVRKYSFRGLVHRAYLRYHYTMSISQKGSSLCQ